VSDYIRAREEAPIGTHVVLTSGATHFHGTVARYSMSSGGEDRFHIDVNLCPENPSMFSAVVRPGFLQKYDWKPCDTCVSAFRTKHHDRIDRDVASAVTLPFHLYVGWTAHYGAQLRRMAGEYSDPDRAYLDLRDYADAALEAANQT
jgi:hypothetical protein